jgi:hypothetical protein
MTSRSIATGARLRRLLVFLLASAPAATCLAGGWSPLTNQPPANASTMLLLTDGRVLMNDGGTVHWWLLTPDANGSYRNGTWRAAADANYDRLYFASAVLAGGQVIVSGGEYSSLGGSETNATEIYDPVADAWTTISPPTGWSNVGDAPASVLADGRWLIGSIFGSDTAIFDPQTGAWSAGPSKLNASSTEESWTLMPDGSVVSVDCYGHPGSQRFDPSTNAWIDCGSTPVDLIEAASLEVGPGILMNDGRALFVGAAPHCALYTLPTSPGGAGSWSQGGDPPKVAGSFIGAKDAPGCLLTNGNALCALGPVDGVAGDFLAPTYFYEFDGSVFHKVTVPGNSNGPPYTGRMLLLPTGEVLFAAVTIDVYASDGGPNAAWMPAVTSVSSDLLPGQSYALSGTQLNGLSQASNYGDDAQCATNYPLVRLTNQATGHVFYCRTHDHSSMGVATGATLVSTTFDVPAAVEKGAATLEVVANGIASTGVSVTVHDPITIDFDSLGAAVQVTNQYPEATFSSDAGFANWTDLQSAGNSPPNALATGPDTGGVDGLHDTFVDFTRPVVALTFHAIGVDATGPVASVNVYVNGALAGTVAVNGVGDPLTPVKVDLTAFHDVTRIELVGITDPNGLAWDDFVFGIDSPASWANYGVGFPGKLGVPSLTAEANPVLGTSVTLDLGNSAGKSAAALVLIGLQEATIPTTKGGDLLLVPSYTVPVVLPLFGLKLSGSIPNDINLAGVEVDVQALEVDSGAAKGLSFTAGLKLILGY